ncbi:hypothetical protein ARMGADRAFT_1039324 [Armillaria gallica]|uniref:Uncharacterized protein n=1 Tax=Armillaria gallica TaxID=47427 RepID=A0A2H3CE67_ARMGA|nr:hypothetical protein ARMGADRAFT_1039324 [Armillaria gallica]
MDRKFILGNSKFSSSWGKAFGIYFNGKNFGGGCIIGWLPIVEEEEDHKGKPSWINFKRVIWHEAFRKILGFITQYSHSGYAFQLPNSEKVIILYPFILILSADYEEQLPGQQAKIIVDKQILFAAQAVLTKAADPAELDVYAAMDVHMENTIKKGQSIMQVFGERMQAYIKATVDSGFKTPTTWDILKMHTQKHLFSDIQAKGVTKNYNTKINESMHGPLKKAYQTQTNFKNVAEQILRTDHWYNVAMQI